MKNVFTSLIYQSVSFVVKQRKCRSNNSACYICDKEYASLLYFSPKRKLKLIKKHRFINKNIFAYGVSVKVKWTPSSFKCISSDGEQLATFKINRSVAFLNIVSIGTILWVGGGDIFLILGRRLYFLKSTCYFQPFN